MSRFLLKISYDGTFYHGWQVQPNGITVQQILCEKLAQIIKHNVAVTGCSRTDAGVHANEFYCHFDSDIDIPEKAYVLGLNAILPKDIAAISCKKVSDDFHARYSAKGKQYIYRFYDGDTRNPFMRLYSHKTDFKLNTERMNVFCKAIIGTHDFAGFSSSKRTVVDTVRTIKECFCERDGDIVTLTVSADGFLYNMVRIIAGTALDVSCGRIKLTDIEKIIESGDRSLAGTTLSPEGLFLNKVIY